MDKARNTINKAKVLVCQLEVPMKSSMAAMRDFKGVTILNIAPAPLENTVQLFTLPKILCLNELEAASVTKRRVPNIA